MVLFRKRCQHGSLITKWHMSGQLLKGLWLICGMFRVLLWTCYIKIVKKAMAESWRLLFLILSHRVFNMFSQNRPDWWLFLRFDWDSDRAYPNVLSDSEHSVCDMRNAKLIMSTRRRIVHSWPRQTLIKTRTSVAPSCCVRLTLAEDRR